MRLISLGATSSEPIVDRKRGASVSACASIVFFGIAGGSRRPFVGENAHAKKWKKQALEQHSFALQRSRGKVRRQLVFFSFSACFFFFALIPFRRITHRDDGARAGASPGRSRGDDARPRAGRGCLHSPESVRIRRDGENEKGGIEETERESKG